MNSDSTIHLEKCSHVLSDFVRECNHCRKNRNSLSEGLNSLLETYGSIKRFILVQDMYSQFGLWTSNFISNHLHHANQGSHVVPILLKPYTANGVSRGSEIYLSILSLINSLSNSTSVMIRGLNDVICNPSNSDAAGVVDDKDLQLSSFESGMTLSQAHKALACDIFMAFGVPPTAYSLWPVNVCANANESSKIFDVRSSLFKYLSLPQKHRVAIDGM